MPGPIPHHLATGIHPGAFVQPTAPLTDDVQDGVLWVDTGPGTPPYQLKVWRASISAWQTVGPASAVDTTGTLAGACLVFASHGATICNDVFGILHFNMPSVTHALDGTGYMLPGGHHLEVA